MEMPAYFPEELMNMGPVFDYKPPEKGTPGYRLSQRLAPRDRAWAQIENARAVIKEIDGKPLPNEHWLGINKRDQEKLKVKRVKQNARHFGFTFSDNRDFRETLYQNLEDVIDEFGKKLSVKERWLIQYRTKDRWFSTTIDTATLPRLKEQIYEETLEWLASPEEDRAALLDQDIVHSDSPLHKSIWHIQELHFLDVTAYNGLAILNREAM